ncbi:MAG: haloalkane dehalogenase [Pseudomonadota bacterium]
MIRTPVSACLWFALTGALAGCSDGSDNSLASAAPSEADVSTGIPDVLPCDLPTDEISVRATESGIDYVRTPDACFDHLVDYPYSPNYADIDGLRMHYIDEGAAGGEVVLMLHGQPSWSYLYRKMIPVLVDAGYRVIAVDHIGMGRSDKPVDPRVHTYDQQVAWNQAFIAALELDNITLFVQDWGSLIGLRVAGEAPELFSRIVVANGNLPAFPPGVNPFTAPTFEFAESAPGATEFFAGQTGDFVENFQSWIDYAASAPSLFAADVVQLISLLDIPEEQLRAYNAPFPDPIYWGAIRAFPSMISGFNGQTVAPYAELGRFDRPFLFLAGEFDTNLGSEQNQNSWIAHVPGSVGQDHRRYQANHFIQEDVGEEIAAQVVEFMRDNPIPETGPLFNLRYCEILLVLATGEQLEAEVYNTIGLNDCPQDAWDALDLNQIRIEQGALIALRNGPRYWLMDRIAPINSEESPPVDGFGDIATFGELEMSLGGIVQLNSGATSENTPYVVNDVQRNTIFTFVAGRRVFELEDPDGHRYIMQSMSQMIDPDLQLYELIFLEEVLTLPEGWAFSTRVLKEDLTLVADGLARVVTDDLSNTYQKVNAQ